MQNVRIILLCGQCNIAPLKCSEPINILSVKNSFFNYSGRLVKLSMHKTLPIGTCACFECHLCLTGYFCSIKALVLSVHYPIIVLCLCFKLQIHIRTITFFGNHCAVTVKVYACLSWKCTFCRNPLPNNLGSYLPMSCLPLDGCTTITILW